MASEELEGYLLKLAVFHGARAVTFAKWGDNLEEEFITGALFGAIASAFPLLAFSAGVTPGHNTTLRWGQFKKAGSFAKGSDAEHESKSGADFALLLCVADNDYRLALFQAKRATGNAVDVFRPPSGASAQLRDTQLVTLWKKAKKIWREVSAAHLVGRPNISWAHYLAYGLNAMRCIPLSELRPWYFLEKRGQSGRNVLLLKRDPTFSRLLAQGFKRRVGNAPVVGKWLCLTYDQAIARIPPLLSLTDLYFVDRRVAGKTLTLDLITERGLRPPDSVIENIAAAKLRNFRPPPSLGPNPAPAPSNAPFPDRKRRHGFGQS